MQSYLPEAFFNIRTPLQKVAEVLRRDCYLMSCWFYQSFAVKLWDIKTALKLLNCSFEYLSWI